MPDQLSLVTNGKPTPIPGRAPKHYEYRRKYRTEPTRAFIYENAPVGTVTAVLELDEPSSRRWDPIGVGFEPNAWHPRRPG